MKQIKIFSSDVELGEDTVIDTNDWIARHPDLNIIDIKMSCSKHDFYVMVIYEK